MSATDLIADMLTRIRNASMVKFDKVDIVLTKMNQSLSDILKEEGYIKNFKVLSGDDGFGILRLYLKYNEQNRPVINGIRRESRSGLRNYVKHDSIPVVRNGLGTSILSTSKGVVTGEKAAKLQVGGEYICSVW
ncbi:MAG: 30S ribosomal protein S8 [Deltaproteobacteria bacterium]|nr:MAG: 30S ribosomal protein S8 [Deltaproteobacteria bacterium]